MQSVNELTLDQQIYLEFLNACIMWGCEGQDDGGAYAEKALKLYLNSIFMSTEHKNQVHNLIMEEEKENWEGSLAGFPESWEQFITDYRLDYYLKEVNKEN